MVEGRETPTPIVDQIKWPEQPLLRDTKLWQRNIAIVKTLSAQADEVKWLDGAPGKDSYQHIPQTYQIGEVSVNFLPHWGFYKINERNFNLPESTDVPTETCLSVVVSDIVHMKREQAYLKERAHRLTPPSATIDK